MLGFGISTKSVKYTLFCFAFVSCAEFTGKSSLESV